VSEDFSFLIEQLRTSIPEAIWQGIKDGLASARRPVKYRKWERVKEEDRKLNQSDRAYVWSKEEYEGTFLEFVHYNNKDAESEMIIETPDGRLVGAPLSQVRFVDL